MNRKNRLIIKKVKLLKKNKKNKFFILISKTIWYQHTKIK